MNETVLVTGAGGFVGGHLTGYLLSKGHSVRAVSSRPTSAWTQLHPGAQNIQADLRSFSQCRAAVKNVAWIYNLAAKVGGIGYIGQHKSGCLSSVLINTNLLRASIDASALAGYLFVSSACIYGTSDIPIRESTPPWPSPGYGEEKLFSESVCRAFAEDYDIPMRIVRPTGIYGPGDDIKGAEDRDHVPAALCRKIIAAKRSGQKEIIIWGDGNQTRDFLYVHDLVEGMYRLQQLSGLPGCNTFNIAAPEVVTVNQLCDIVSEIAAYPVTRCYNLEAPEGVRRRQLFTGALWHHLRWLPPTSLRTGMDALYRDIWEKTM